jgi:hypothetical protein
MMAVGEETGALDTMLSKVADFYDQEVEAAVASLTSMIGPILNCRDGRGRRRHGNCAAYAAVQPH